MIIRIYTGNNKVVYRDEKDKFNIQDSLYNFNYEFEKVYVMTLNDISKTALQDHYVYLGEFQSPEEFREKYPEEFI